jgi:hypothetical protein
MKSSIFWDITPYSLLKVIGRFGGTCCLQCQGRRIIQARNQHGASSKKMEATCSSEISVEFQQTTCSYIPEDTRNLHTRWSENLRFYIPKYIYFISSYCLRVVKTAPLSVTQNHLQGLHCIKIKSLKYTSLSCLCNAKTNITRTLKFIHI